MQFPAFATVALIIGVTMVLLAIVKEIKTKWITIGLPSGSILRWLTGFLGILIVIGSFGINTTSLSADPGNSTALEEAQSTISALQTQLVFSPTPPTIISIPTAQPIAITSSLPQTTSISTPILFFTPTLTLTQSPSSDVSSELFCINFYSVIIRTGPGDIYEIQSVLKNPNNLSNPDCLLFDFRMPDNSWIRIAPHQPDPNYSKYELGWLYSDQVRPNDIDRLGIYIPDGVQEGLYCITNRFGINVRDCPGDSCSITGKLSMRDCLIIDARTDDNQWVRVAQTQKDNKYLQFANGWISICCIMPSEFSAEYQPFLRYYIESLQIATPMPTPGG